MEEQPGYKEGSEEASSAAATEQAIDREKLAQLIDRIRGEQRYTYAWLAGTGACLASAVLWAVVTVATGYQIGYMAVAVGLIVGFSFRYAGKGIDRKFGITGAVLALLGCLIGNFLSIIAFVSQAEGYPFMDVLVFIDYSVVPELMVSSFSPMDLLFYGIAVYEGYKFSLRPIKDEEIVAHAGVFNE